MMKKKIFLFVGLWLIPIMLWSQCPVFTDLNASGVICQYGTFNNPFMNTGIAYGRHTVITQQGGDPNTGYQLPFLPPGENAVVKLGNEQVGAEAEAVTYQFTVDNDSSILLLKYAVVFDDPQHPAPTQPHFLVRVLDAAGNPVETCIDFDVAAWNSEGIIPGFLSYGIVKYRPWDVVGINLSDYAGQQIRLQFVTYDCAWHDHFGYAYFTASFVSNKLSLTSCNGNQITLSAPLGFAGYYWDNGSTSSNATYSVTNTTNVNCTISSLTGCQFLLSGTISNQSMPHTTDSVVFDTICEGEPYNGHSFALPVQNVSGMHLFRNTFFNIAECLENGPTTTLFLTTSQKYYHIYDTVCLGSDYMENGFNITNLQERERLDSLIFNRQYGCDSIVVLHLTVTPFYTLSGYISGNNTPCVQDVHTYTCSGVDTNVPLSWSVSDGLTILDGQGTQTVDVYFDENAIAPAIISVTGANNCVSGEVTISISHHPYYHLFYQDSICSGNEYHGYGFDLARQDSAGWFTFTQHYTTVNGCDSVRILQLLVTGTPTLTTLAQPAEICAGQNTAIHALGENASFSQGGTTPTVAIGDILCTDNSIVKPSAWPVAGKTAMGIVFYVDNSGEHGWVVHLQDQSTYIRWGGGGTDIPTLTNYYSGRSAISDLNGYANTQKIRNAGNSATYPAAWATDFANGWYLPAIGQLSLLFAELVTLNSSLDVVGGTKFPTNYYFWYWSSTEYDQTYAWKVSIDGNTHFDYKSGYNAGNYMRSVRDF